MHDPFRALTDRGAFDGGGGAGRALWSSLAIVLPLAVAAIVVYPGCVMAPPEVCSTDDPCSSNDESCNSDGFCEERAVYCSGDADCDGDEACNENGVCVQPCDGDDDCSGAGEHCDPVDGVCEVQCNGDGDCEAHQFCDHEMNECVAQHAFCDDDSDCGEGSCDSVEGVCGGDAADEDYYSDLFSGGENAPTIESDDLGPGASGQVTLHLFTPAGAPQVNLLIIELPEDVTVNSLPKGEIGELTLDPAVGATHTLPILQSSATGAWVDGNGDGVQDPWETTISILPGTGGGKSVWIDLPLGGDADATQSSEPVAVDTRLVLNEGIVGNPPTGGSLDTTVFIRRVDPTTGGAPDDRPPGPTVEQLQVPVTGPACDAGAPEGDSSGTVFAVEGQGFDLLQVVKQIGVPAGPVEGDVFVDRICGNLEQRGTVSPAPIQVVLFADKGGEPGNLLGVAQAPLESGGADVTCTGDLAELVTGSEKVWVGFSFDPTTHDLGIPVYRGTEPGKPMRARASQTGPEGLPDTWQDLLDVAADLTDLDVSASFFKTPHQPDLSFWTELQRDGDPQELAFGPTNGGGGWTGWNTLRSPGPGGTPTDILEIFHINQETGEEIRRPLDLPNGPKGRGGEWTQLNPQGTLSGTSIIENRQLGLLTAETGFGPNGEPTLEARNTIVDPRPIWYESNFAVLDGVPYVQGLNLGSPPFHRDLFRGEPGADPGTFTFVPQGAFDVPGVTDIGGVFDAPAGQMFSLAGNLCVTIPVATAATASGPTALKIVGTCVNQFPVEPGTFIDLTPSLPIADGADEVEGVRYSVMSDPFGARTLTDVVAQFFIDQFNPTTGDGTIGVFTVSADGDGQMVLGGYRAGLVSFDGAPGAQPDFAVTIDSIGTAGESGTITLCAAQATCTRWDTENSADPDTWTSRGELIASVSGTPLEFDAIWASDSTAIASVSNLLVGAAAAAPQLEGGPARAPRANDGPALVAQALDVPRPCVPGPGTVCLRSDQRFDVSATWRTPQGETGIGLLREVTADSGVATFFNADNVELFYKSLDACGLPGFQSKWFFLTGLTDVEVVTSLRDAMTGSVRKYVNPLRRPFRPVLDTRAFVDCPLVAEGADAGAGADAARALAGLVTGEQAQALPGWARDAIAEAAAGVEPLPWERTVARGKCVPTATRLCLNDRRFAVDVSFAAPNGQSGDGRTFVLTNDTGAFTFFNRSNLEMLIKVLDACSTPFDSFWVFAAGLTNVEVTVTVTDTQTGTVKTYRNPQQTPFVPIQDTSAFATCP